MMANTQNFEKAFNKQDCYEIQIELITKAIQSYRNH